MINPSLHHIRPEKGDMIAITIPVGNMAVEEINDYMIRIKDMLGLDAKHPEVDFIYLPARSGCCNGCKN